MIATTAAHAIPGVPLVVRLTLMGIGLPTPWIEGRLGPLGNAPAAAAFMPVSSLFDGSTNLFAVTGDIPAARSALIEARRALDDHRAATTPPRHAAAE